MPLPDNAPSTRHQPARELGPHNPFDRDRPRRSTCFAPLDGRLVPVDAPDQPVAPLAELIHDQFEALVRSKRFSCLAAKSALRGGHYRLGAYAELGSEAATADLAHDLFAFGHSRQPDAPARCLVTFVASFVGPTPTSEAEFEALLWRQLQALHERDRALHGWDPTVSVDPADPRFAFSFAERAYFVVGLHAASSRWARRFAWPTLVFNPHQQFERLRAAGIFEGLRDQIRRRELALQGSLLTTLGDFGAHSEARQYAGRAARADWRCPFAAGAGPQPLIDGEHP